MKGFRRLGIRAIREDRRDTGMLSFQGLRMCKVRGVRSKVFGESRGVRVGFERFVFLGAGVKG